MIHGFVFDAEIFDPTIYLFSVLWHPSGDSTDVITLSDNHILKWDMEASGTNGRVRKLRFFMN